MTSFKQLFAAGTLALAGLGAAHADPVQRGTYVPMDSGAPGVFSNTWTLDSSAFAALPSGTEFADGYVVNLPDDEYVDFSLASNDITFEGFVLYALGWDVSVLDVEPATDPHALSGGTWLLTSGSYELDIYGIVDADGASYTAAVGGSPVPEPGSWALLLAGLAATASLARRARGRQS